MFWKESKVIDQVMGVSYWSGIPTFEICLVRGVAQMAKDSCCIQRKLKPQVDDVTALGCAILLHTKAGS
jgi:hypothetical protein